MRNLLARGLFAALCALALLGTGTSDDSTTKVSLAVILNTKNPKTNVTSNELRRYLKLEQQFWPDDEPVALFLRPSTTTEMKILLDEVYKMSASSLRKYWVGRVFRGEIAARPPSVPTAADAGVQVRGHPGGISLVLSDDVPDGVRVLSIDGKRPGEEGYPLSVMVKPVPDGQASRAPNGAAR